jgi:predicted nucleotidyltransferase
MRGTKGGLPETVQAALEAVKKSLVEIYGDRLRQVYLYGSYARGDFTEGSDVDLLIALEGKVNPWQEINRLSEVLAAICLNYDLLISTYPVPEEWLQERQSPLFKNIRREGIVI